MKITKTGTKKIKREYKGAVICKKCGSQIEYDDLDVKTRQTGISGSINKDSFSGSYTYKHYINCPYCKKEIRVLSKREKITILVLSIISVIILSLQLFLIFNTF